MIKVIELSKTYGEVKAVNGISFQVKKGELFAFLGLNGAGKSTTINIISGVLAKDSGTVMVDGLNIDQEPMAVKAKIGIVYQHSVLDKKLSVYDNLKVKAALYGIKGNAFKQRLHELNGLLDLKPILKRQLEKLSGGQRRKADIARALVHSPQLLILDEPTTGLDPQTRRLVWDCLNQLRQEKGMTVFFSTHYMEEAAEAENTVILDGGSIVAYDTPNKLKNKYANDFIRIYGTSEAVNEMLKKEALKASAKEGYLEIEVDSTFRARQLLLSYPEVFDDFEIVKGRMDDVFLKVTGKDFKEVEFDA